ncbi:MAG TPA: hypothetical protein VK157_06610 [Phycisphaerales bacterium]|nr:hypothetical protein [Phycisphaerales bacterium]
MSTFPDPSVPPAFDAYQPPPGWVKPIGIISIVIGSLGLVCNCFGAAMIPLQSKMLDMVPQLQGKQLPPELVLGPISYLIVLLSLASSALLLTAGIMLLKHNPLSRMLHIAYAALAVPLTIIGIMMQVKQTNAMNDWMAANGVPSNPGQGVGQFVGMGCGAIIGLAYPIFLLIWFLAMGKKVPPPANLPAA